MAFVSVKFQRITAYIICILCIVVIYNIYRVGNNHPRSTKATHRLADVEDSRPLNVRREAHIGHGLAMEDTSRYEERDNISVYRIREENLRREIGTLKWKLSDSHNHNKQLEDKLGNMEDKAKTLTKEIAKLKQRNEYLLAEVKLFQNTSWYDQRSINGSEEKRTNDEKNGSTKYHINIPESIPFESFAKTHVFEAVSDPKPKEYMFRGHRKETRVVKSNRKHIIEVQNLIIAKLNFNKSLQITTEHLFDGVYRFDVNTGVDYEMYFKHPLITNSVIPVRLTRGLKQPKIEVLSNVKRKTNEMINFIIPLSGRIERFQNFIELFIDICVKKDKNVFLTVVLYGEKDFKTVKSILQNLENEYDFRKYQLVMRDKKFSRGRALHDGVRYWKGSDVLMFFCDIDVTFRPDFLRRCRAYTEPGKQVYYPVVFSLYNPKNVYEDGNVPEPDYQQRIDRRYGFWRSYGFGMTCQYRDDYLRVGGFDLSIEGWGSEDQLLHSRYIAHHGIRVVRAPDRDLFHNYHEKYCDPNLKWGQYRSCLGSKAKTEGTPAQIAMQFMKLREKYQVLDEKD